MENKVRGLSSDAYCYNMFEVMLQLAIPFLSVGNSKLDSIDPEYITTHHRFEISSNPMFSGEGQEEYKQEESAFDDGTPS